jgi:hypothetical protein
MSLRFPSISPLLFPYALFFASSVFWLYAELRARNVDNWSPANAIVADREYLISDGRADVQMRVEIDGIHSDATMSLNESAMNALNTSDLGEWQSAHVYHGFFFEEVCLDRLWNECYRKHKWSYLGPLLAIGVLLFAAVYTLVLLWRDRSRRGRQQDVPVTEPGRALSRA